MQQQYVEKPVKRSKLRRLLGKKYYVLRRKIDWILNAGTFAKKNQSGEFPVSLVKHKSLLLRPLKGVDMYLQRNKITNLKLAISHIDEVIIKPGETFSVWYLVGRPTKAKGYLHGLTLKNGNISKDIGGGLCQLGNLIYWMSLHTPLTIKERWRHSYDVFPDVNRKIPFACGATLSYNYIDLQLQNNTGKSFRINLWLDDEYLNGEITCDSPVQEKYEIFETDHIFKLQWWGGYTRHNRIWRRKINHTDNLVTDELIAENSAIMMYSPLLESKKD